MHKFLNLTQDDLKTIADIMFLAWRSDFVLLEETGEYISRRDVLLQQVAQVEDKISCYYSDCKKCAVSDREYDELNELKVKLILQVCEVPFGINTQSDDYEDQIYNLSQVGENLGWEFALQQVNERFPNRVVSNPNKKRGRHWRRTSYFHAVKEYAEVLERNILFSDGVYGNSNPAPYLKVESIKFCGVKSWLHTKGLISNLPSDEIIFSEFSRIMEDKQHPYFELFKAVNKDTDLLLLSSKKALERSLAIGRNNVRFTEVPNKG